MQGIKTKMKKFKLNVKIFSFIILAISTISIFAHQDFNTVTDEQLFFFLKQWPECNINEDTKKACNDEMSKVSGASPRSKHNFFQIINSYQDVAIKAGNNPDEAQRKTEDDLSNFLKTEFRVDVPEEVDSKEYPELVKFIRKYGLPHIFCKEAGKYKENIKHVHYGIVKDLPDFFLKDDDIARIINAERMRRCIHVNKLDQLDVPKKYLGKVGDSWRVFAEKINSPGEKMISLKETQQLATLAEEIGFGDWGTNWSHDDNNKFVCFDTEDFSFRYWGRKDCKVKSLMALGYNFLKYMEVEAQEWLIERIKKLKNCAEDISGDISLDSNTKYDDPEIDFEEVKKEFESLKEKYKI